MPDMPSADLDDSDDEIGPMPDADDGPSVEMSKGRKKKRAVLPHERVFLDNMPDTDRYTKSFMHRADLNFVTMTKCALSLPVFWLATRSWMVVDDTQTWVPADDFGGWALEAVEEAGGRDRVCQALPGVSEVHCRSVGQ